MKILIGVIGILVLFTTITPAFAQLGAPLSKHPIADYKLGLKHGLYDGGCTGIIGYYWSL
jgi:hypothetical protein